MGPLSNFKSLQLFTLLILFISYSAFSQTTVDSKNGWVMPTSGTIRVLFVFAEVEYDLNPTYDPSPNGTTQWPKGQLPTWKNLFADPTITPNPQGYFTKYFKKASFGNLNVLGDVLIIPLNPNKPVVG